MPEWVRDLLPPSLDPGRPARRLAAKAAELAAVDPPHPRLRELSASGTRLISLVVPVYNTRPEYLADLLASFGKQILPGRTENLFEMVLSDDGSTEAETLGWLNTHASEPNLRILRNSENRGIAAATNAGICAANGEWIALIDHDDAIAPYGLERIARVLVDHPEAQFLYTDELITDGKLNPEGAFLKPAWDEVLLSGVNYINHFSVYRRERLMALGLLRDGFQGSQDYDLLLRYTRGLRAGEVRHLPYPAYLWRRDGSSYSALYMEKATANARKALAERYEQGGQPLAVLPALNPDLHRPDFAGARQSWPSVSVIIPSRNAKALIEQVMQGLIEKTDYPDLEIIIVDNGSDDAEVLALYKTWRAGPVPFRADIVPEPFNFSRAVNRGLRQARGEVLLLLNNDIEILEPGWLKEMVSCLAYPDTGIVGAKLLYSDRKIQHVGVIAGLGGLAGHWFIGKGPGTPGPMGRLHVRQSLSVVTGACFLISRACWEKVGPFDEEKFAIAYNDVDFCLRALEQGVRVVWTPFAELIHHESASRGSDETPQNIERFRREQNNLRERHRTDTFRDRAYSPWWRTSHSLPAEIMIDKLPSPR